MATRPLQEFLGLFAGARVEAIADVRSFPGWRRYPQLLQTARLPTFMSGLKS